MTPITKSFFRIEQQPGQTLVVLTTTSLERSFAQHFATTLRAETANAHNLLIDLGALDYCDHFGFEALLSLVRQSAGVVRFRAAKPPIQSLFTLSHLDRLLTQA